MSDDQSPQEALQELIANFAVVIECAPYLAEHKKRMYDEYLVAGFTEHQAIELVKGVG